MDYRDLCIRRRGSSGVSEFKTAQNLFKSNFASLAELIAINALIHSIGKKLQRHFLMIHWRYFCRYETFCDRLLAGTLMVLWAWNKCVWDGSQWLAYYSAITAQHVTMPTMQRDKESESLIASINLFIVNHPQMFNLTLKLNHAQMSL